MVTPEMILRYEQDADLGFDLRCQGQGRWPKFVNFERSQHIAGMWTENAASEVTFRCECNADLGFD